jgi:hypothetical protein
MVLADHRSWDGPPVPEPLEFDRLDHNDYWNPDSPKPVLSASLLDSVLCQDLLLAGTANRDRDFLAPEIPKRLKKDIRLFQPVL